MLKWLWLSVFFMNNFANKHNTRYQNYTLGSRGRLNAPRSGFTIVELLIVIVVIAVLAAISVVAYNGLQQRAHSTSAKAAVLQVAKKLAAYSIDDGSYPNTLADISIQDSDGTTYEYTNYSSGGQPSFCITTTTGGVSYKIDSSNISKPIEGACSNHLSSGSVPRGVNIAPPASLWTVSGAGGVEFDSSSDEFKFTKGLSGYIQSPFIRIDGPRRVLVRAKSYSTQPSVNNAPDSAVHTNISYYAADKTTRVQNDGGYTGNGNAAKGPLNTWFDYEGAYGTNSNIIYVRVNFSSSSYTSDNILKDLEVVVLD